jgi:hypothetical protein
MQLIYAGKVLKDNAMPLSAFISTETSSPVAIHIVVKGASTTSSNIPAVELERPNSALNLERSIPREEREVPVREVTAPAAVQEEVVGTEPTSMAAAPAPAAAQTAPEAIPAPVSQAVVSAPQVNMPAQQQATASTSKQQADPLPMTPPAAAASQASTPPPPASPFPPGMESHYSNQMAYSVAYQAAYQAALQSILAVQQQQQQQHHKNSPSSSNTAEGSSNNTNQPQPQAAGQMLYHMPMHIPMPFAPPMPYYYNYDPYNPMMMPPPPQQQMQQHFPGAAGMDMRQRRRAAVVAAVAGGPDGRVPEDLLRRIRELRNRGFQLPPELVVALDREDARAAGNLANGVRAPRIHRFQFRIQVNIRALLQLAVLLVVVYQHCPPKRFAVLCLLGFALWLSTTPRVRAFLQQIAGLGPNNNNNRRGAGVAVPAPAPGPGAADEQPVPAAAVPAAVGPAPAGEERIPAAAAAAAVQPDTGAAANPDNPLDAQQPEVQQQPRAGILHEIHAFIAGFITSLLPAMDQNNNDEAGGAMRDVFGGAQ